MSARNTPFGIIRPCGFCTNVKNLKINSKFINKKQIVNQPIRIKSIIYNIKNYSHPMETLRLYQQSFFITKFIILKRIAPLPLLSKTPNINKNKRTYHDFTYTINCKIKAR